MSDPRDFCDHAMCNCPTPESSAESDAAWDLLLSDLFMPDRSVIMSVERNRPLIEAALSRPAIPPLDVERLNAAYAAAYDAGIIASDRQIRAVIDAYRVGRCECGAAMDDPAIHGTGANRHRAALANPTPEPEG